MFLRPLKWMFISEVNSAWFSGLHERHLPIFSSSPVPTECIIISTPLSIFWVGFRKIPLSNKTENLDQNRNGVNN
jgi:hypothetical protein